MTSSSFIEHKPAFIPLPRIVRILLYGWSGKISSESCLKTSIHEQTIRTCQTDHTFILMSLIHITDPLPLDLILIQNRILTRYIIVCLNSKVISYLIQQPVNSNISIIYSHILESLANGISFGFFFVTLLSHNSLMAFLFDIITGSRKETGTSQFKTQIFQKQKVGRYWFFKKGSFPWFNLQKHLLFPLSGPILPSSCKISRILI